MIRITALGTIRVVSDTHDELALIGQQPKRLALLAYLAIARPRGAQRRDRILGLLWPGLDQTRARSALRQALHTLRATFGAELIVSSGNESVALNAHVLQCDVWELEDAIAAGNHAKAVDLYRGDLGAGLFLSDAPEFDDWLEHERGRVRALVRTSAWIEAERLAALGAPINAVALARQALALSELDESALRQAMRIAGSVGDASAATTMFDSFSATLHRELDVEPSAETKATLAGIRSQASRTPVRIGSSSQKPIDVRPEESSSNDRSTARRHRRRTVRVVAAAAAAIVAIAAGARLAPSAPTALDARRVRVAELVNESALPELDTLARDASVAIRASLLRLDNVRVLSRAGDADAGTEVRGSLHAVDDSIELRADVVDRATHAIVRSTVTRVSGRTGAADAFADRVSAAVATALYPGWGNALSQPASYAAYRGFLDGMRSIKRERHDLALAAFQRAYAADSSFTAAGLLAAMESYQMRRYVAADSLATTIAMRRSTLSPIDSRLLDWLQRSLGGDRIGARNAMAAVVALAPAADLARLQLAIDNVETARPDSALAQLARIDPESEFGEGWLAYWATQIEALHIAEDHERELSVTREALRRHPEFRTLLAYELRALGALGRVSEVERAAAEISEAPSTDALDPRIAIRQSALELAAHGSPAVARRVLERLREWYASRPPSERSTLHYQLGLARTAYLLDDHRVAARLYRQVLRDHPGCIDCVGALGVLAARSSNQRGVDSSLTLLRHVPRPFLFGRPLEWQARIAAASGHSTEAIALQAAAFASGAEFDVMTHADPDMRGVRPDSIYRAFVRADITAR